MYRRWTVGSYDETVVNRLTDAGVNHLVAKVLASRGIESPDELGSFLNSELPRINPFSLTGMEDAVDRIRMAVDDGEKILVFGDYDTDGVTSTALLTEYLKSIGADVTFDLPDRIKDGYGLNVSAVDSAKAKGISLIVTVDNGINCCTPIDRANELGIDVVVTDHHMPLENLPDAVALVDPHLENNPDEYKVLAGVGVAYMLVAALSEKEPIEILKEYGDIIALGTVADIMPLTGINRAIVKIGLDILNKTPRTGIAALLQNNSYQGKELTSTNLSFVISPRINAAGRMGSAVTALELLLTDNVEEANRIAGEINDRNVKRQQIEQSIFAEAVEMIENQNLKYDKVIVVAGENWHPGIVGIAAARLAERYGRPTVVLIKNGDVSYGSGRGIPGFSLFEGLHSVADILIRFGGHAMAAGLALNTCDIELLRDRLNHSELTEEMPFITVRSDCAVDNCELTLDTVYALKGLEPYGAGNPLPVFLLKGMKIEHIAHLSNGLHQKLTVSRGGERYQALYFGIKNDEFPLYEGDTADLAVILNTNEFKGEESLSIQVKAIRKTASGGADCEKAVRRYESFKRKEIGKSDASEMLPSRDDFAAIYRFFSLHTISSGEAVENALSKQIGYDKTEICLEVFLERGLIQKEVKDGVMFYQKTAFSGKTKLEESPTVIELKKISEKEELTC